MRKKTRPAGEEPCGIVLRRRSSRRKVAELGARTRDLAGAAAIVAMSKQVEQFDTLRCNISARISKEGADNVLSRSLFLLSTGGNDIFAFFSANSTPTPAQKQLFTANLVSHT
jgi:hypothetical protein